MTTLWRALTQNHSRTSAASPDPALSGRTYAIPFAQVWRAALTLASQPRWRVVGADEDEGVLQAEATTRLTRSVADVVVRISLDHDAQTRVEMESRSRVGGADLGANRRRIRRFMASMDHVLSAGPATILS